MVLLYSKMIPLGTPAPKFSLKGTDAKIYSLDDYKDSEFLLIIFMCNHCPYVQALWDDLLLLWKANPKVQFLGINANANPNYPDDSFENMQKIVREKGEHFPYLFDEKQEVSKAYGAECTPDFFLYGHDRKLAYRGSFAGLTIAFEALKEGKPSPEDQKPSMGCSIKWLN